MPLYSYTCKTCEVTSAISRSIHDPEVIPACLKCDQPMQRQYSTPAVTFKGSGFYSTDKR
jgi:putative FmdB family regulatory protein